MQDGHSVIKFHPTAKRLTVRYWVFSVLHDAAFWRVAVNMDLKKNDLLLQSEFNFRNISLNKKLRKHLCKSRK